MILFPAIDVLNNCCVRLEKGDYEKVTVYSDNLVELAMDFEKKGAEYIHMVDLNAARSGEPTNYEVIGKVAKSVDIPVQVGGGVRSIEACENLLELGVQRVIVGTLAITNKPLLEKLVEKYPSRVIVSLDVKGDKVAIKGWEEVSQENLYDTCAYLEKIGVDTIVCTDIAKDGMLQGPNFRLYKRLKYMTNLNVIVSGGISKIEDIEVVRDQGLYGVISGKAIYDNRLDLEEAIRCLQNV